MIPMEGTCIDTDMGKMHMVEETEEADFTEGAHVAEVHGYEGHVCRQPILKEDRENKRES
jgi:hypothetical protein